MQFDLRKFIATGTQPYHAEFPCDLSARDFAGARIEQPVTASFTAEPDGDAVRMTLRAKALVHGECARCLDPVEREETVEAEWTAKERDLDDPDFELPLDEKGHLDVDEWACPGVYVPDPHGVALQRRLPGYALVRQEEGRLYLPAGGRQSRSC